MNTANRVILIILFLSVITLCTLVLIVPVQALNVLSATAYNLACSLKSIPWYVLLPVGLLAALVIDMGAIALVYRQRNSQ